MLRRVTKQEYEKDKFHQTTDGLSYCLDCWKYIMHGTKAANLGTKPMGGMTANQDGYGRDINEEQLAQDSKIGAATNAAIDSLSHRQKWAVYKTLGMGQVIRFNFADLVQTYQEATEELKKKLAKNIDTSYLF